jgi:iron complex outermembrane receptor protein
MRLDNLVLSYRLPDLGNGRFNAQFSLIGQNLLVLTNYNGLDPEVAGGIDNNFYPVPRTVSLGINLGFQ